MRLSMHKVIPMITSGVLREVTFINVRTGNRHSFTFLGDPYTGIVSVFYNTEKVAHISCSRILTLRAPRESTRKVAEVLWYCWRHILEGDLPPYIYITAGKSSFVKKLEYNLVD